MIQIPEDSGVARYTKVSQRRPCFLHWAIEPQEGKGSIFELYNLFTCKYTWNTSMRWKVDVDKCKFTIFF